MLGHCPPACISGQHTSDSKGAGDFESNLTGLTPNTLYYARAYATNKAGTAYGNEVSFTTLPLVAPVITTVEVTGIGSSSAISGGNISSDGGAEITARGVCWATAANPTISDNKTTNGTGTGIFASNITGLVPGTAYHVRAYATNNIGTSYGNDITFTASAVTATYPQRQFHGLHGSCGFRRKHHFKRRSCSNCQGSMLGHIGQSDSRWTAYNRWHGLRILCKQPNRSDSQYILSCQGVCHQQCRYFIRKRKDIPDKSCLDSFSHNRFCFFGYP